MGVSAHQHLGKKPYMLYIMGISAHRHFREKTLCHTSRGMLAHPHFREQTMYYTSSVCQHIHTSGEKKKQHIHTSGKKPMYCMSWVCQHTHTSGKKFYMLHAVDVGSNNFVNRPCCFLHTALIFPTYEKNMGASMPVAYWQVLYWHLAYVKTLGEWTLVKYSVIFRATHGDG